MRPNNDLLINPEQFSEPQIEQITAFIERMTQALGSLNSQERAACLMLWTILARSAAPVVLTSLHQREAGHIRAAVEHLVAAGVVWYDPELKSILQCPPFSALSTRHRVKAFGWNPAHVCSFLDAPLSLLLYGPNTWLQVRSTCPFSGQELTFRLMMDDTLHLHAETPPEAADWRVWVFSPLASASTPDHEGTRLHASLFRSADDLAAYRQQHEDPGLAYTFAEALRLSEALISTYKHSLSD